MNLLNLSSTNGSAYLRLDHPQIEHLQLFLVYEDMNNVIGVKIYVLLPNKFIQIITRIFS